MTHLHLALSMDDPFDGLMRVLIDAQRFGAQLEQIDLRPGAETYLRLALPQGHDPEIVAGRFARHPAISGVRRLAQGRCP